MKTLYIVRGLPGSGKSSLAKKVTEAVYSADDFFTNKKGEYNFNVKLLGKAHEWCWGKVRDAMYIGVQAVAVANTFTQGWEAEKYYQIAEEYGYSVFVIECQNDFGNVHDVPQKSIDAMKERWEKDLTPVGNLS
jgi:predicted kinase|tara:strand:+ start:87 stop:488 length:402 start_codon:yes stop_codon:yes gene_type:complete